MKKSACIQLYGIVQGVGMRYHVFTKASRLGLTGYVKNMSDGSVKIEAEGEEADILSLVDYVKNGVRWARVEHVEIKWDDFKDSYKRFEILG